MAVLVAGTPPIVAGCGGGPLRPPGPDARLAAAVLSVRDLPPGFLPADDQKVFRGVRPVDPDCARLLALADRGGLRGVPQGQAVFYRADPGASLAEHVLRLSPQAAAQRITAVRAAALACPQIVVRMGAHDMRLNRVPLTIPGSFGVRYVGASPGGQIRFDIVLAQSGENLLVLTHPAMSGGGAGRGTEEIAATAIRKLQATFGSAAAP